MQHNPEVIKSEINGCLKQYSSVPAFSPLDDITMHCKVLTILTIESSDPDACTATAEYLQQTIYTLMCINVQDSFRYVEKLETTNKLNAYVSLLWTAVDYLTHSRDTI